MSHSIFELTDSCPESEQQLLAMEEETWAGCMTEVREALSEGDWEVPTSEVWSKGQASLTHRARTLAGSLESVVWLVDCAGMRYHNRQTVAASVSERQRQMMRGLLFWLMCSDWSNARTLKTPRSARVPPSSASASPLVPSGRTAAGATTPLTPIVRAPPLKPAASAAQSPSAARVSPLSVGRPQSSSSSVQTGPSTESVTNPGSSSAVGSSSMTPEVIVTVNLRLLLLTLLGELDRRFRSDDHCSEHTLSSLMTIEESNPQDRGLLFECLFGTVVGQWLAPTSRLKPQSVSNLFDLLEWRLTEDFSQFDSFSLKSHDNRNGMNTTMYSSKLVRQCKVFRSWLSLRLRPLMCDCIELGRVSRKHIEICQRLSCLLSWFVRKLCVFIGHCETSISMNTTNQPSSMMSSPMQSGRMSRNKIHSSFTTDSRTQSVIIKAKLQGFWQATRDDLCVMFYRLLRLIENHSHSERSIKNCQMMEIRCVNEIFALMRRLCRVSSSSSSSSTNNNNNNTVNTPNHQKNERMRLPRDGLSGLLSSQDHSLGFLFDIDTIRLCQHSFQVLELRPLWGFLLSNDESIANHPPSSAPNHGKLPLSSSVSSSAASSSSTGMSPIRSGMNRLLDEARRTPQSPHRRPLQAPGSATIMTKPMQQNSSPLLLKFVMNNNNNPDLMMDHRMLLKMESLSVSKLKFALTYAQRMDVSLLIREAVKNQTRKQQQQQQQGHKDPTIKNEKDSMKKAIDDDAPILSTATVDDSFDLDNQVRQMLIERHLSRNQCFRHVTDFLRYLIWIPCFTPIRRIECEIRAQIIVCLLRFSRVSSLMSPNIPSPKSDHLSASDQSSSESVTLRTQKIQLRSLIVESLVYDLLWKPVTVNQSSSLMNSDSPLVDFILVDVLNLIHHQSVAAESVSHSSAQSSTDRNDTEDVPMTSVMAAVVKPDPPMIDDLILSVLEYLKKTVEYYSKSHTMSVPEHLQRLFQPTVSRKLLSHICFSLATHLNHWKVLGIGEWLTHSQQWLHLRSMIDPVASSRLSTMKRGLPSLSLGGSSLSSNGVGPSSSSSLSSSMFLNTRLSFTDGDDSSTMLVNLSREMRQFLQRVNQGQGFSELLVFKVTESPPYLLPTEFVRKFVLPESLDMVVQGLISDLQSLKDDPNAEVSQWCSVLFSWCLQSSSNPKKSTTTVSVSKTSKSRLLIRFLNSIPRLRQLLLVFDAVSLPLTDLVFGPVGLTDTPIQFPQRRDFACSVCVSLDTATINHDCGSQTPRSVSPPCDSSTSDDQSSSISFAHHSSHKLICSRRMWGDTVVCNLCNAEWSDDEYPTWHCCNFSTKPATDSKMDEDYCSFDACHTCVLTQGLIRSSMYHGCVSQHCSSSMRTTTTMKKKKKTPTLTDTNNNNNNLNPSSMVVFLRMLMDDFTALITILECSSSMNHVIPSLVALCTIYIQVTSAGVLRMECDTDSLKEMTLSTVKFWRLICGCQSSIINSQSIIDLVCRALFGIPMYLPFLSLAVTVSANMSSNPLMRSLNLAFDDYLCPMMSDRLAFAVIGAAMTNPTSANSATSSSNSSISASSSSSAAIDQSGSSKPFTNQICSVLQRWLIWKHDLIKQLLVLSSSELSKHSSGQLPALLESTARLTRAKLEQAKEDIIESHLSSLVGFVAKLGRIIAGPTNPAIEAAQLRHLIVTWFVQFTRLCACFDSLSTNKKSTSTRTRSSQKQSKSSSSNSLFGRLQSSVHRLFHIFLTNFSVMLPAKSDDRRRLGSPTVSRGPLSSTASVTGGLRSASSSLTPSMEIVRSPATAAQKRTLSEMQKTSVPNATINGSLKRTSVTSRQSRTGSIGVTKSLSSSLSSSQSRNDKNHYLKKKVRRRWRCIHIEILSDILVQSDRIVIQSFAIFLKGFVLSVLDRHRIGIGTSSSARGSRSSSSSSSSIITKTSTMTTTTTTTADAATISALSCMAASDVRRITNWLCLFSKLMTVTETRIQVLNLDKHSNSNDTNDDSDEEDSTPPLDLLFDNDDLIETLKHFAQMLCSILSIKHTLKGSSQLLIDSLRRYEFVLRSLWTPNELESSPKKSKSKSSKKIKAMKKKSPTLVTTFSSNPNGHQSKRSSSSTPAAKSTSPASSLKKSLSKEDRNVRNEEEEDVEIDPAFEDFELFSNDDEENEQGDDTNPLNASSTSTLIQTNTEELGSMNGLKKSEQTQKQEDPSIELLEDDDEDVDDGGERGDQNPAPMNDGMSVKMEVDVNEDDAEVDDDEEDEFGPSSMTRKYSVGCPQSGKSGSDHKNAQLSDDWMRGEEPIHLAHPPVSKRVKIDHSAAKVSLLANKTDAKSGKGKGKKKNSKNSTADDINGDDDSNMDSSWFS